MNLILKTAQMRKLSRPLKTCECTRLTIAHLYWPSASSRPVTAEYIPGFPFSSWQIKIAHHTFIVNHEGIGPSAFLQRMLQQELLYSLQLPPETHIHPSAPSDHPSRLIVQPTDHERHASAVLMTKTNILDHQSSCTKKCHKLFYQ